MTAPVVHVVDYGAGNVRSLRAALERAGARVELASDPAAVRGATRLMVPGQGAAGTAMSELATRGLLQPLRAALADGAYLLGVCVGLQLLFAGSAEQDATCLGLLEGRVEHLDGVERLPHMGWNDVEPVRAHPLAAGLPSVAYFAHSYAVRDAGAATIGMTEVDGVRFASLVAQGRVAGAQFHPERSGPAGLALLRGFLAWSAGEGGERAA